jgi:Fusaric acid resistance protein-like
LNAASFLAWLRKRDRDLSALRRAGRTAIVMPAMFALGDKVIGSFNVAAFAAFGSFATLTLVDFRGPLRDRLQAQLALALTGGVFICAGTLASHNAWLAAAAMALVTFCVLFAGVVSSVLAGASTSLLLAFILPVSLAGTVSTIPDRLEGWGLAAAASLVAIAVLWPAPTRDSLRAPAVAACRALAARLRSEAAGMLGGAAAPSVEQHAGAVAEADAAVGALHRGFLATPYRPTGLSTPARTIVRLVDDLNWLNAIVQSRPLPGAGTLARSTCDVKVAAAVALERGANLLEQPGASPEALHSALVELRGSLDTMERSATVEGPIAMAQESAGQIADEQRASEFVTALDPSFRAQELSFAVSQVAGNIELTAVAERRGWWERLLGRQPEGVGGTLAAARERAAAHFDRNSVWLHNSVRGAVGLGLAVFVANRTGVQHSFWVVFGTLSVLRSNALNTGQFIARGVLGTAIGFAVGSAVVAAIGTNTTLLWVLLPVVVLFAGVAPAVISFTAGQAAFTLTLLILFNIIQPAGWRIGLVRVEDVALGCAVSLVVGLLFWPRGAGAALRQALATAYADSARYLDKSIEYGMHCCDFNRPSPSPPSGDAVRAVAASRRLDDAFRSYLAERGAKPVPLAEVTSLVTGVAALRLTADAVLDLWQRDEHQAEGDRAAARAELLQTSGLVKGWYDELAASLAEHSEVPVPLTRDTAADDRFVDAVRHDLFARDGNATATAVRMIWTGDHLDAARRLQAALVEPARATTDRRALSPLAGIRPWRLTRA